MNRPRLPRWLRKDTWVTDAPATDLSSLDVRDGVGTRGPLSDWDETRPGGECPPLSDDQAMRLRRDLFNACETCGWLPDSNGHVLVHHPSGTHVVTYGESTRTYTVYPHVQTVYDQEYPLASEVEAWLASLGGAQ